MTSRLYDHVWEQWCADTGQLLKELPAALASSGPTPQATGQMLERWLLLLKVRQPSSQTWPSSGPDCKGCKGADCNVCSDLGAQMSM